MEKFMFQIKKTKVAIKNENESISFSSVRRKFV